MSQDRVLTGAEAEALLDPNAKTPETEAERDARLAKEYEGWSIEKLRRHAEGVEFESLCAQDLLARTFAALSEESEEDFDQVVGEINEYFPEGLFRFDPVCDDCGEPLDENGGH